MKINEIYFGDCLDSCAGSGTTAIAAINTKRNFILIENNQKYFEIASKRIKEKNEFCHNQI